MVILFLYLSKPATSMSIYDRDLYIFNTGSLTGRLGFITPPCMRTHLNFSRVNEIEAMCGRSLVISLNFYVTRDFLYIASILLRT